MEYGSYRPEAASQKRLGNQGRFTQVIFSTTSYRFEIDSATDEEWLPKFGGFEQPMYLRYFNNILD